MGIKRTYAYEPDYAVPPGETLRETIAALGIDPHELATRMGMPVEYIGQIIEGVAPITDEMAEKLEDATGVPARLWNKLEMDYRVLLARTKSA